MLILFTEGEFIVLDYFDDAFLSVQSFFGKIHKALFLN